MYTNLFNAKKIKAAAKTLAAVLMLTATAEVSAQGVAEVITDYNGYWKSSTAAVSSVKPDNSHNLLSFSFNGTRYSTGANDASLSAHGDTFTPEIFRAMPMQNFTGTVTSNTKIGLGAMADGVYNGTSGAAPSRSMGNYLNDGINGLDLGTGVANIPAGTMFLSVNNLQAASINDGVPDILVTQVADPSSKYDRYEFTDINGNRVGNSLDVVLTNITPVGNWVADFFEATGSQVLTAGFTQTPRGLRLWAADLGAFGIDASNVSSIAYFKITLSGDSDVAFVAYNTTTINVSATLDLSSDIARTERLTRTSTRDEKKAVSVYPNPARSFVNMTHSTAKGNEKIMVYNMQGILLMESGVSKGSTITRLDIPSLRPGSYQAVYINDETKASQMLIVGA
jgi:hypothetical protein